jgi:hypothetical protein
MPRNAVRIISGVTTNETPAINEAGIANCNLIRLKYDPQGIILPEKLGGWSRFFANQVTSIIRRLCGWQDVNLQKWLAYGSVGNGSSLVALQCFQNASTGLVTASTNPTSIYAITPQYVSNHSPVSFATMAASSVVTIVDPNETGVTVYDTINITTPVSAGGLVLSGLYPIVAIAGAHSYQIIAKNVLQQPVGATYTTLAAPVTVTGASVAGGIITITFASQAYSFLTGEAIVLSGVLPPSLNGTYIVETTTTNPCTSVTAFAPNASGTYTSGGTLNNLGSVPLLTTTSMSNLVSVTFPDHGYSIGSTFVVLNQTNIGGISLFGQYAVVSVLNSYTFTFYATVSATATETNFANAQAVVNGVLSGTAVTLTFSIAGYSPTPTNLIFAVGATILVSDITPANWNGTFIVTAATPTTVTYTNASATGTWASGGSVSDNGGDEDFVYNITPGPPQTSTLYGYGVYGTGVYNGAAAAPPLLGSPVYGTNWELDNWGSILLALPVNFSPILYPGAPMLQQGIYAWDPTSGQALASIIPNAPSSSNGFFVAMPQRQIVAWGSTQDGVIDPLLVCWCDVNNFNVWAAQITNQAGSFRLSSGSGIVGGLQGPQQSFLWTNISLWTMQYVGPPNVYSFNRVADGCGLISRHAAASLDNTVYWMGSEQFFALSGSGVAVIPCPVWDVVFQQLDRANVDKITVAANSLFSEITWYYPVVGGNGEVTNYIRFNASLSQWDFGVLGRSAWIDTSALGQPIGYDPANNYIYQHEISPDADGQAMMSFFTTGYFTLNDGSKKTFIDEVWFDAKFGYYDQGQLSTVNLTFQAADFPGQTPTAYGPYPFMQSSTFISPRIRARLLSITMSSNDLGSFWRIGLMRYRWQSDGVY